MFTGFLGIVKWFNEKKGYGVMIYTDQHDLEWEVFFHINDGRSFQYKWGMYMPAYVKDSKPSHTPKVGETICFQTYFDWTGKGFKATSWGFHLEFVQLQRNPPTNPNL